MLLFGQPLNEDPNGLIDAKDNWWGSIDGPYPQDIGEGDGEIDSSLWLQAAPQYDRFTVAVYAIGQSRCNFAWFPFSFTTPTIRNRVVGSVGGPFRYSGLAAHTGGNTGSALFISEALYAGFMPTTLGSGGLADCNSTTVDAWRPCCGSQPYMAGATGPWRAHPRLVDYFSQRGALVKVLPFSSVAAHINFPLGTLIDPINGPQQLADLFRNDLILAAITTGDYIYLDQRPPDGAVAHGFLIVGWGPAVNCLNGLNADETGLFPNRTRFYMNKPSNLNLIPYVVDFSYGIEANVAGWLQDPRPRPFYCSAATILQSQLAQLSQAVLGYNATDYIRRLGGIAFNRFVKYAGSPPEPTTNLPDWTFVRMPTTSVGTGNTVFTTPAPC